MSGRASRHLGAHPSTLGTFLSSLRRADARSLDKVAGELLSRVWSAGAGPGASPLTIDVDSSLCVTYGLKKRLINKGTGVGVWVPKDAEGPVGRRRSKTVFRYRAGDLRSVSAAVSPRRSLVWAPRTDELSSKPNQARTRQQVCQWLRRSRTG